jgi:hypothetical protein
MPTLYLAISGITVKDGAPWTDACYMAAKFIEGGRDEIRKRAVEEGRKLKRCSQRCGAPLPPPPVAYLY